MSDAAVPFQECDPEFTLDNTEIGFKHLSDHELRRAKLLYRLLNHEFVARQGARWIARALRWRLPIQGLVKVTMYDHFCGGIRHAELDPLVGRLASFGVKTVCDYAVEQGQTETVFKTTCQEIIDNITFAQAHPRHVPFVVFKTTALMSSDLLVKISSDGPLSDAEQLQWEQAQQRLDKIFQAAAKAQIPVLVDAEESWFNLAIDAIVEEASRRYNRGDYPIIFQTHQMYLRGRLPYLVTQIEAARRNGYRLGFKLVRGAYHEKECKRALDRGYPVPVFARKEDTDAAFDEAVQYCLSHLDTAKIFIGSHNQLSIEKAARAMIDSQIPRGTPSVCFSQLYGMSDPLTFNLAHHGFQACKYIPYGEIKDTIPYLVRRAEENTSVAGQVSRELQLVSAEMQRRQACLPN